MMEQLKHQLSDKRASGPVKLTLDVENTVTKRNGKLHLDPFEPDNTLSRRQVIRMKIQNDILL